MIDPRGYVIGNRKQLPGDELVHILAQEPVDNLSPAPAPIGEKNNYRYANPTSSET
jgi:hypothetical protein